MEYARHQRALAKRDKDGRTAREHLVFARDRARDPARRAMVAAKLAGPEMPRGYRPVWELFTEIARWRSAGAMGAASLTLHDIAAWESRFLPDGVRLSPEELDLVKRLDHVMLSEN